MSRARDRFWPHPWQGATRATAGAFAAAVLVTSAVAGLGASASPQPASAGRPLPARPASATSYLPGMSSAASWWATVPATAGTTRLPVVICPTTFGAPPPAKVVPLPRSLPVTGTEPMIRRLAVYTDTLGRMKLLAPRRWDCSALDAADGSENLVVHPVATKLTATTTTWALPKASRAQAVVGTETSACIGCQEAQACPLFAAAARDYRSDYGQPCPERRPNNESVVPIGPGLVAFSDPSGVRGDGRPSGGRYPANGVMTYYRHSANGSWLETCVLPSAQKATCSVLLDNFTALYAKL